MILDFIVWNLDPALFKLGPLEIRWYGLFFAIAFYIGYIILAKFFKEENIPAELLDKLTLYIALGTILGARLGHCLFYEPTYYLNQPFEILKIWKGGLASHGAAIGIVVALYSFSIKNRRSFFWVMDKVVIVIALGGFCVRAGNLMNSEIYGTPTNKTSGFVYARSYSRIFDDDKKIKSIKFEALPYDTLRNGRFVPLQANVIFSKKMRNIEINKKYVENEMNYRLSRNIKDLEKDIVLFPDDEFNYNMGQIDKSFTATFKVWGVPKHPTQIYEAFTYLLIFLILFYLYYKRNIKDKNGFLFGVFMVTAFSARFIIENLKENQVSFEDKMSLNMGQILSIPIILAGIISIIYSLKSNKT